MITRNNLALRDPPFTTAINKDGSFYASILSGGVYSSAIVPQLQYLSFSPHMLISREKVVFEIEALLLIPF